MDHETQSYSPLIEEGKGSMKKSLVSKKVVLTLLGVAAVVACMFGTAGYMVGRSATVAQPASVETTINAVSGCSSVSDSQKKECGYMGITQSDCENKQCCWATSSVSNVPWCFTSSGSSSGGSTTTTNTTGTCSVSDYDKQDCGTLASTQSTCESSGCCWSPAGQGSSVPWCYKKSGSGSSSGGSVGSSCFKASTSGLTAPFSASEISTMKSLFLANLDYQGTGAVVAAPDAGTPGGSYIFHWKRDGALSMATLQMISSSLSDYDNYFKKYAKFVATTLTKSDPNVDVRVEPKFNINDASPYTGGWCRPQIDGAGLEAITLIDYANALTDTSIVSQYLWTSGAYMGGIIKADLDYLVNNWGNDNCDLWEEVHSNGFFWNRMAYYKAFVKGAAFAQKMGDSSRATTYNSAAQKVYATLSSHWTGSFVYESQNRQKDGAVIIAFSDGYVDGDKMFNPIGEYVASTISQYNQVFCNEYAINRADTNNGIAGVLYGRYPGDSYAGGNPWHLLSAGLAQLMYRGAIEARKTQSLPTGNALTNWLAIFGVSKFESANAFADQLAAGGDGVMERLRFHIKAKNFHCDEQIDKNNGNQVSAKDLTWSYAVMLKALKAREQYMAIRVQANYNPRAGIAAVF